MGHPILKRKIQFLLFLLATFVVLPSTTVSSHQGGSVPFSFGHHAGIEVPRMYSGYFTISADAIETTTYIFGTENTSTDGDPVMLLLDDETGETLDIEDDVFASKNPAISVDVPPGETRTIRAVIASFDEAYAGQTDLVVQRSLPGEPAEEHQRISGVRFGSLRIDASWQQGDVVRAVGHYESETLRDACEGPLGGEWDFVERDCVTGSNVFDPTTTCELAYPNRGLRFNAVYPHGSRCEKTTRTKDTMLMAAEGWSKEDVEVCFGTSCYYFDRAQYADDGGFDDDGGAGATAKLVMPDDSDAQYPAIVVGLHPWNDRYAPVDQYNWDNFSSPVDADEIRIYRDRASNATNDSDRDGLTDALESSIGLDPTRADTSEDGIIDGLAVYGADGFPFPNLGVVADEKNVVVEVDHTDSEQWAINESRVDQMRAAGYALDEVGMNFLALTGDYATYEVTTCDLYCSGLSCGWNCSDTDEPVLPASNTTPVIPTSEIDPVSFCGDTSCIDASHPSFDLSHFPFARRMAWLKISALSCGRAQEIDGPGTGRLAVVQCDGATFIHELGHLLGLHHGGYGDERPHKPNYWSIMSEGISLPLPGHGDTPMITKSTYDLDGPIEWAPLRFSDTDFIPLDENALDEEAGLTGGYCIGGDCSHYSAPYMFESIRDPANPTEWSDIDVTWLDWDGNGTPSSSMEVRNINRDCVETAGGDFRNETTGDVGDRSVCREVLQPHNDQYYFDNVMDQTLWSSCGNLDSQRTELGLPSVTSCIVSPPATEDVICE
jgi:hypothetical protein